MPHRDPGGRTRWHRLLPRDLGDLALIGLALVGLLFNVLHGLGLDGSEAGPLAWALAPLLALHGSSPVFFFLGIAIYLMRWGRALAGERRWIWGGFLLTVPLWFLVGQPIAVRGAGNVTFLVVPWNLLALGVMWIGAWRTLRSQSVGGSGRR